MKSNYFLILLFIFLFGSCASWKEVLISKGNYNDAVQNAINDFLHTSRLTKKDTVFSVDFKNINNEIIGVSIIGSNNKLFPSPKNKIGTNHPYFPTMYFEYDDKLFYWYDSTHYITKDLIVSLAKYKHIDSLNVYGIVGIPEITINESKKGVDYYFCKNNLLKYKKIVNNRAMGWYDPPKLNCDSHK